MIMLISQTPTIGLTPTAVVYNQPLPSHDRAGQQLGEIFNAIRNNQVAQSDKVDPLSDIMQQINSLRELNENWGGCDVVAPDPAAIEQAKSWIASMRRDASIGGSSWINPHVSASEDGDVSFEWWKGPKKMTVYVSARDTLLLRVWGLDISSQMSEGKAETIEQRQSAWTWLLS